MGSVRGRLALLAGALVALAGAALAPGPPGHAAQGGAAVAVVDFAFDPMLTQVAVGDAITWTNYGAETHTVTADDSSFTSGPLEPGGSFRAAFAAGGSFTYRCRIHPSMTGTIVVNGGVGETSAGAAPEIEAAPVVGVGTAAPRPLAAVAILAGLAAFVLGAASLVLRRA